MKPKTLHEAFVKAQSEFPLIKKSESNPFFKSKYAPLPSILEVVIPILHSNNLYFTQMPISESERIGIKTLITYVDTGESLESSFTVHLTKQDPQGAGSALSYCRRYALVSMLGLNVDDDDDANAASTPVAKQQAIKNPTAYVGSQAKIDKELGF